MVSKKPKVVNVKPPKATPKEPVVKAKTVKMTNEAWSQQNLIYGPNRAERDKCYPC